MVNYRFSPLSVEKVFGQRPPALSSEGVPGAERGSSQVIRALDSPGDTPCCPHVTEDS